MSKTLVVIPAMNEAESIAYVLQDLKYCIQVDVVVVDDASIDDTAEVAQRNGAIVLKHTINLGAWRSVQTGIRYALSKGYKNVITCDADGQHPASSVKILMDHQKDLAHGKADCMIGSCVSRGSHGRHIVWRFFKWIAGLDVSDLTSGLRFYNEQALTLLATSKATMFDYQDVAVLMLFKQNGFKMKEVAVQMNERENGISRIFNSWLAVLRYMLYTFVLAVSKISSKIQQPRCLRY